MISNLRRRRQNSRNLRELRDMIRHSASQGVRNDLPAIVARADLSGR